MAGDECTGEDEAGHRPINDEDQIAVALGRHGHVVRRTFEFLGDPVLYPQGATVDPGLRAREPGLGDPAAVQVVDREHHGHPSEAGCPYKTDRLTLSTTKWCKSFSRHFYPCHAGPPA